MTTPARVAAAAVIGVLALGGALYALGPVGSGFGGPGPTASPTPSPTPVALVDGPLAAGRYVTAPFDPTWPSTFCPDGPGNCPMGVCVANQPGCTENPADDKIRISFTLPAGWEGAPRNSVALRSKVVPTGVAGLRAGRIALLGPLPAPADARHPGRSVRRRLRQRTRRPSDARCDHARRRHPCRVSGEVHGPSGAGSHVPRQHDDPVADQEYWPWEPGFRNGPGSRWHLWILDVNGVRVVIQAMDFAGTSAQHQTELRAIVDSIQIQS